MFRRDLILLLALLLASPAPACDADMCSLGAYVQVPTPDLDRAIAACTHCLEQNPSDAEAFSRRGSLLLRKGDYDPAIADLSAANKLYAPERYENSAIMLFRGTAYQRKGDCPSAIADFENAMAFQQWGRSQAALQGLCECYLTVGQPERSKAACDEATSIGSLDADGETY
jgi:tetratricopeptide (TPR) repeat protein